LSQVHDENEKRKDLSPQADPNTFVRDSITKGVSFAKRNIIQNFPENVQRPHIRSVSKVEGSNH
jgi:hypothetical protein